MKRIGIVPFLSLALVTPAMAEERPIAVQWEGVQNLISGVIVRKDSSTGEFRIFLSNPEQECRGIVSTPSGNPAGTWALACPAGLTATGTFLGRGDGQGGDGTGQDVQGRKLTLLIAPRSGQLQATPVPNNSSSAAADPYAKTVAPAPAASQSSPSPGSAIAAPRTSPALQSDSSRVLSCGFLKLSGMGARDSSVKCETSKRTHNNGGDVEIVDLTVRLDPGDSYLRLFSEKDVSGYGWRPIDSEQIASSNRAWASKFNPRNVTNVTGGAFRNSKFNITDRVDYACARGNAVGSKVARGSGEARHHVWITYCEHGTHTVSDENLGKVFSALTMD